MAKFECHNVFPSEVWDKTQDRLWINWRRIRDTLAESHPVPPLDPPPPGFRLVDVEEHKVIHAPRMPFTYVCLSYVWGELGENDILATTETICDLEKTGSLSGSRVPATIRDAMTACHRLGQKYLWVDRLCILQDDGSPHGQKQVQIESMGEIYNHAFATFVAISATNANSELPGISKPLELETLKDSGPFARRKIVHGNRSKWHSRGWTFQEDLLSRRLIYFTEYDTVVEIRDENKFYWSRDGVKEYNELPQLQRRVYNAAVQNYVRRELGRHSDAVNAFSGICSHLFGPHRFCLPEAGFDIAVCWVNMWPRKEKRFPHSPQTFPSWSWVSIHSGTTRFSKLFCRHALPVASWAFVDVNAQGIPIMKCARPSPLMSFYSSLTVYLGIQACKSGLLFKFPGEAWLVEESYEVFHQQWRHGDQSRWPPYETFWEASHGFNHLNPQEQPLYFREFSERHQTLATRPGRILALSQTVTLDTRTTHKSQKDLNMRANFVVELDSRPIGFGWFDDPEEMQGYQSKKITFLALSLAGEDRSHMNLYLHKESFHSFSANGDDEVGNLIFAMAIEETEEAGVFRRIGFGVIYRKKWTEMDRKTSSIVLE